MIDQQVVPVGVVNFLGHGAETGNGKGIIPALPFFETHKDVHILVLWHTKLPIHAPGAVIVFGYALQSAVPSKYPPQKAPPIATAGGGTGMGILGGGTGIGNGTATLIPSGSILAAGPL